MKIQSISNINYASKFQAQRKNSQPMLTSGVNFQGKHTCRNIGLGVGSAVGLVGFGLWNLATGGVPLLIYGLAAGGTAAAGAFGDALDKMDEPDKKK